MKKIVIYTLLSIGLFACKKSDEKVIETQTDVDSTTLEPVKTNSNSVDLKEFSPEKFSETLASVHPDTLYVTNFFATWCAPCMQEIPHFRKKMDELANQPVKFTFVSLDNKTDWATDVQDFADEYNLGKNIILLNGALLNSSFFMQNFKTWRGETIPFTLIKKGNQSDETNGSMSEEMLNQKIQTFLK